MHASLPTGCDVVAMQMHAMLYVSQDEHVALGEKCRTAEVCVCVFCSLVNHS